jgi:lysophospholipase L1-like esterase
MYRNGTLEGQYTAAASGENTNYEVLSGGSQTILLRDGTTAGADHAKISKVSFNAAATRSSIAAPSKRLVVLGDSISVGFRATNPTTEAWAMLVRAAYTGRTTSYGAGSATFRGFAETTELRSATAANILNMADGTSSNQVWIALGYNDASAGWSAASFEAAYRAFLQLLLATIPHAVVFAQSPIAATDEALPTTLPAIRAATLAACTGLAGVTYVDGLSLSVPIGPDGIHPDTAGSVTYANAVLALI